MTIISKNPNVEEKYFINDCIFFMKIAKQILGVATKIDISKFVIKPLNPS